MKHLHLPSVFAFLLATICTACVTQYRVEGITDRGLLEGKMLYVKVFEDGNMVTIDSCQVRHGQLTFAGELDTAKFVTIYMGNEYVGPLVLEEGIINVALNELQSELKGGPYNDSLNIFLTQFQHYFRSREYLYEEYRRSQKLGTQLILDGYSVEESDKLCRQKMTEVVTQLNELEAKQDALETSFIVRNSNNILGPGVFMLMTWKHPYPYLTPQIEEILIRSYPYLREHPYVKSYVEAAKNNMEQMRNE